MKAFVYWNLHKNVWSLKAMEGEFKGKVVAHSDRVALLNATPKVSQAGRLRVIKEQCKNVHAGIVGEVASLGGNFDMKYGLNVDDIKCHYGDSKDAMLSVSLESRQQLYYNPYRVEQFVYADSTEPFVGSKIVVLSNDKKVFSFETKGE